MSILLSGCASLADRIVEPRSISTLPPDALASIKRGLGVTEHHWQPSEGPGLAYRVVQPREYGMDYEVDRTAGHTRFDFRFHFASPDAPHAPVPVRGSIIYLHGWGLDGDAMLPWALALARRGWRGVVVDLRNHGGSGRAPAGFGTHEGDDIASLLAALQADGTIEGGTHLFGVSYGAVSAIFASATLADAIDGVVAVSPYANAADGIRGLVGGSLLQEGGGLVQRVMRAHARRRYTPQRVEAALDDAGRRLGIDLEQVDTAGALARTGACTLLLHAGNDGFFEAGDIRALASASPLAQYIEVPDESHLTLPVRLDLLLDPIDAWLRATSAGPPGCPLFSPAAAPEHDADATGRYSQPFWRASR